MWSSGNKRPCILTRYQMFAFVFGSSCMTKLKVCTTSCRCACDLIVSHRVNLSYKRHLDSYTVGYRYNAVQYIKLLHTVMTEMPAAEHKSDFELTKPVSRASYEVFVVGIWGKLHRYNTITLYMNILKSITHWGPTTHQWAISSLAQMMASHLLGARPLSKPIVP